MSNPQMLDILIIFVIAVSFLTALITLSFRFFRKFFILRAAGFLGILGCLVLVYGSYIEPKHITINHQELDLCAERGDDECNNESLKIALIADWHLGPYKQEHFVERAVRKIQKQDAAILLMPGDIVYDDGDEARFLQPLEQLDIPVYATLGNHDYTRYEQGIAPPANVRIASLSNAIEKTTEEFGVEVLRNELVFDTDTKLMIYGQEDWWMRPWENLPEFEAPPEDTVLTILLQHNPDGAFQEGVDAFDLVLSGHTHGGQIRLPLIGSIWPIPTDLGRAYDRGWFDLTHGGRLFITQGIGETGPRARLLAPPEIVIIEVSY